MDISEIVKVVNSLAQQRKDTSTRVSPAGTHAAIYT